MILLYMVIFVYSTILPLTNDNYHDVMLNSPILILSSKSSASKHVKFLESAFPELQLQLPTLLAYHYRYSNPTKSLQTPLIDSNNKTRIFLKRDNTVIKYRGKLVLSAFITFVWSNIKQYSVELSDYDFESTTQAFTWVDNVDWLIQFHGAQSISPHIWSEIGYKLDGYVRLGSVNISQNYYLHVRFQDQLNNISIPGVVFFSNTSLYIYSGKIAVDILTDFARKTYFPKKIHKKFFLNEPPQQIPVPPPIKVYSFSQYTSLPEFYNTVYIFLGALIVYAIRKYLINLDEKGKILSKEEKSE